MREWGQITFYFLSALAIGLLVVVLYPVQGRTATTIEITDRGFIPNDVEIAQGEGVLFVNTDTAEHWPASNFHPTHTEYPGSDVRKCGSFSAPFIFDACRLLTQNESYTFTFTMPGEWKFHDHASGKYSGRVVVHAVENYQVPFFILLKKKFFGLLDNVHAMFIGPGSYAKRLVVKPGSQGLVVGNLFSLESLISEDDYESQSIYHYTFNDLDIRKVVHQLGVRRTMEKIIEESNEGMLFDCHIGAHYIGRAGYDVFGIAAFKECDNSCHSGCYHGVMEAYFWEHGSGDITKNIENICSAFSVDFERQQCFHGSGHGLLALSEYDLPKALDTCKTFALPDEVSSCFGGVFMENITAALGFSASLSTHTTEWLSYDDLQFPCTTLDSESEERMRCFEMQTSWMFVMLHTDYQELANACAQAPEEADRQACFRSFGRDAGGNTLREPDRIQGLCALVPDEYYLLCIKGTTSSAIDFWGTGLNHRVPPFCDAMVREDARNTCYERLIERVPDLFEAADERRLACDRMSPPYREQCLKQVF